MTSVKSLVVVCSAGAVSLSLLAAGGQVRDITASVAVGANETLTITGAAAPQGIVEVAAGGTAVLATRSVSDSVSTCVLADDLRNGLAVWMDGSTNVILNGEGKVGEWRDVRDSVSAAPAECMYPRAVHVANYYDYFVSTAPSVSTYDVYPGRSFVDFGEFNHTEADKSTWLIWRNGAGADQTVKVRSFFAFIRLSGANNTVPVGPLLGHTTINNWFGYNGTQSRMLYTLANAQGVLTNAETRVDGRAVDTAVATWPIGNGFYLFSQIGPYSDGGENSVDNFGNWRGFHSDDLYEQRGEDKRTGTKYDNGNRQGGPIIGEILCYDRVVTDTERRRIEAYLLNKWQGVAFAGTLTGEGAVEKTDAGKVVLDGASKDFGGVMTVASGSVESGTVLGLPPLKALAGKSAAVTNGTAVVADGTSGVFAVNGEGELALGAVGGGVTKITSEGVDLAIRSRATWQEAVSPFYSSVVTLEGASFEAPDVASYSEEVPTGWTSTQTSQTIIDSTETLFHHAALTGPIPDGDQMLCLGARAGMYGGEIQQSFTVTEEGVYGIRFWYAARHQTSGTDVYPCRTQVIVDGTNCVDFTVGYDMRAFLHDGDPVTTQSKLLEYEFPTPSLAPGVHTLVISQQPVVGNGNASVCYIDNVSIQPRARGRFVWVPDSSFDSCGPMGKPANLNTSNDNGVRNYGINQTGGTLLNSAWKGTAGTVASSDYGITQDSRFWWMNGKTNEWTYLADHRKGFILNDGKLYNDSIVFDAPGEYTFSVRYARTDWGNQVNEFRCHAWLSDAGGTVVNDLGKLNPVSKNTSTYEYTFTLAAAGTYTLNFENTDLPAGAGGGGTGYGVVLDDVSFRYGTSLKVLAEMERAGFDEQALARDGSAEMSFALEKGGFYRMAVKLAGLPVNMTGSIGPSHGFDFYPQVADVSFDSVNLGRVVIDSPDTVDFTFRLPYAAAGNHTVRLDSVTELSAKRCIAYLKGLGFEEMVSETAPTDFADSRIELSDGAKLALDFDGTLSIPGLTIDGVAQSDTVSAATSPRIVGRGSLKIVRKGTVVILR